MASLSIDDGASRFDLPNGSLTGLGPPLVFRMLAGRFLALRISCADSFDNTLRRRTLAASTGRKHDHPIIDFDENRRPFRRVGRCERHPTAHHRADPGHDAFNANGLALEIRRLGEQLRDRCRLGHGRGRAERFRPRPPSPARAPSGLWRASVATDMETIRSVVAHKRQRVMRNLHMCKSTQYTGHISHVNTSEWPRRANLLVPAVSRVRVFV